jgi:hypothetical protein
MNFNYKLCNNVILLSQSVKDLGVLLDCIFSGFMKYWVFFFFPLLIVSVFRIPKLEYASVAWNSTASTDSSHSKEFKGNFLPYVITVFVGSCCSNYEGILARLNSSTLYSWLRHLHALFLINVFKNKISCSSIFDPVSVCISTRIIRQLCIYGKSQF